MSLEITDKEFERLVNYMHDNFGINLASKKVLVKGRLGNMLNDRGFKSYTEYIDAVIADTSGAEVTTILNKLTTNHTFFMREPEHYTFMKETILPYMVEQNKQSKTLRIWSAACSSGEECYTTAMLIDEYFGRDKAGWDTRILATDISQNVINKAKEGIYHEDGMKGLSNEWKSRYFNNLGNGNYEICQAIKDEVIFKTFNLMDSINFKRKFDLIFCRNVMIYFDQDTKDALVRRFYNATVPGGHLFIGHSEGLNKATCPYEYIQPAIYRRSAT